MEKLYEELNTLISEHSRIEMTNIGIPKIRLGVSGRPKGYKRYIRERSNLIKYLYRLGEGLTNIASKTGLGMSTINSAIREDSKKEREKMLEARYCNECGEGFLPGRVTQIFCERKCFKAANYKEHLREVRKYVAIKRISPPKPAKTPEQASCIVCSWPYFKKVPTQKFCSQKCLTKNTTKSRAKLVAKGRADALKRLEN